MSNEIIESVYRTLLESSKEKNLNKKEEEEEEEEVTDAVKKLFIETASQHVKWVDIYKSMTMFWNSLQGDDKQDESATTTQAAFIVPLIVTFITVLQTDMQMSANVKDVVNANLAKLFTKKEHLETAKKVLKSLNAMEEDWFDNKLKL